MSDEELVKRLRSYAKDQGGWHNIDDTCEEAADRIETLTEQLEAARADAKEAEAYAEELEKEKERERDEWKSLAEAAIKDDASKNIYYAELKAKLAKAVEALREIAGECGCSTARAIIAEIEGSNAP
jgi:chromosome segregation ATPase